MELVAAIAQNGVIGLNGDMPWHLPADLAHFKKLTTGHAIVMGRRTWDSIGKALPDRVNIVITRQVGFIATDAIVVHSLEEAKGATEGKRLFVIGGGEIYALALPLATHVHITRIVARPDGDTYFPELDVARWKCTESMNHPKDASNQYRLAFETWTLLE